MQSATPPAPLPGHLVLDEASAFLRRFVVFPSAACADAAALWAAHTWAVNAFSASPRLAFLSDGPSSGKTKAMTLTGLLCYAPTLELDPSPSALVGLINERQPTVLLDEIDTVFGTNGGSGSRSLRAILNGGYVAGESRTRRKQDGSTAKENLYAAVALAGIGTLPGPLLTRSIVISMRAKRPEDSAEPYIPRIHKAVGVALGEAVGSWVRSVSIDLAGAWPESVPGVENRQDEIWQCLLAIADQAGQGWPERARAACLELARGAESEPVRSPGQRLLEDLRKVWKNSEDRLSSAELVRRLTALPASPWTARWPGECGPREMSALLAPFGIAPSKMRFDGRPLQGYKLTDVQSVWPVVPALPAPPVPEYPDGVPDSGDAVTCDVPDVPDVPDTVPELVSAPRNARNARNAGTRTRKATVQS